MKSLDEIINSTYNEIKPYVEVILENSKCPNCGSAYIDFTCKYCLSENHELAKSISSIEKILNRFESNVSKFSLEKLSRNKLFDLLYTISNLQIGIVDNFLHKYNYENVLLKDFFIIIQKIDRNIDVSSEELNTIESMIFLNSDNKMFESVYYFFIRQAILKKQNVSYECFCEIIKRFVEKEIKKYYDIGLCIIKPLSDLDIKKKEQCVLGYTLNNIVLLSDEDVKNLYYKGSVSILRTISHELAHCVQFKNIFNGRVANKFEIDELKEYILQTNLSDYYYENHDYITYELYAEKIAIKAQMQLLEKLGFVIDRERCYQEITELDDKMLVRKRIRNGKETTLDNEFEKYVYNHPELLKKHPQLIIFYKIVDNIVLPKSAEDLNLDLQLILNNPEISEEQKEMTKMFYEPFIGFLRK